MTTEEQREWRAESFGKGQWRVIEEDAEGGRVKLVLRLGGDRSLAERVARLPALEREVADLRRQLEATQAELRSVAAGNRPAAGERGSGSVDLPGR